jgi:hypothetical protein
VATRKAALKRVCASPRIKNLLRRSVVAVINAKAIIVGGPDRMAEVSGKLNAAMQWPEVGMDEESPSHDIGTQVSSLKML